LPSASEDSSATQGGVLLDGETGRPEPRARSVAAPLQPGAKWAVRVANVSVTYRTTVESRPTLRKSITRLGRRERAVREVQAVRDVSFRVPRGKVLGVIGVNGAGKSTLMRAIAGILPPTRGKVVVNGQVSTLLALGVGFNRNLTGRENVVLGGLAAGLSREQLREKYDEIVEFAELGNFMDMPMRTYSSGMYGRLAFSVAVNMEPDILIIDEALSVGDARFKRKSFDRMRELCAEDRTILLVSHALRSIRELCDWVVWLHDGELKMKGRPKKVIPAYTQFLEVEEDEVSEEDV
jgi:ABC-type polysaccharide/polyol phosphate transport system ATPase subunit